jgi:hypothetical protein
MICWINQIFEAFYGTGAVMHIDINGWVLIFCVFAFLIWKPVQKGWLSELNVQGLIAKFKDDKHKPPPE